MDRIDLRSTADGAAQSTAQGTVTGWGVVSGVLVGLLFTPVIVFVLFIVGDRLPADLIEYPAQELLGVPLLIGAALLTLLVPSWRRAGAGFALGLALGTLLAISIFWSLIWPILTAFSSS